MLEGKELVCISLGFDAETKGQEKRRRPTGRSLEGRGPQARVTSPTLETGLRASRIGGHY